MKIFSSIYSVVKFILGIKTAPAAGGALADGSTVSVLLGDATKAAEDVIAAGTEVVNVIDQAVHLVFPAGLSATLLADALALIQKATSAAQASGTATPAMSVLQAGQVVSVTTPIAILAEIKGAVVKVEAEAVKVESKIVSVTGELLGDVRNVFSAAENDVETFFTGDATAHVEPTAVAATDSLVIQPGGGLVVPEVPAAASKIIWDAPQEPEAIDPEPVEPAAPVLPPLERIALEVSDALAGEADQFAQSALLDIRAAIAKYNHLTSRV